MAAALRPHGDLFSKIDTRVFRGTSPVFQDEPYSGEGARMFGGRFNPIGLDTLYTCKDFATVGLESKDLAIGELRPKTVGEFTLKCDKILDFQRTKVRKHFGANASLLRNRWLTASGAQFDLRTSSAGDLTKLPYTQLLALKAIAYGANGIIVRSHANGAKAINHNVILFYWNTPDGAQISFLDAKNELPNKIIGQSKNPARSAIISHFGL